MKNYLKYFLVANISMTLGAIGYAYPLNHQCGDSGTPASYSESNPLTTCEGSPIAETDRAKNSISQYGCDMNQSATNGAQLVFIKMDHDNKEYAKGLFALKAGNTYYGGWYNCGYPSQFLTMDPSELRKIAPDLPLTPAEEEEEEQRLQGLRSNLSCDYCQGSPDASVQEDCNNFLENNICDGDDVCNRCFDAIQQVVGTNSPALYQMPTDFDTFVNSLNGQGPFANAHDYKTCYDAIVTNQQCCSLFLTAKRGYNIFGQYGDIDKSQDPDVKKDLCTTAEATITVAKEKLCNGSETELTQATTDYQKFCPELTPDCPKCADIIHTINTGDNITLPIILEIDGEQITVTQQVVDSCKRLGENGACCERLTLLENALALGHVDARDPAVANSGISTESDALNQWQSWFDRNKQTLCANSTAYNTEDIFTFCGQDVADHINEAITTGCDCAQAQAELDSAVAEGGRCEEVLNDLKTQNPDLETKCPTLGCDSSTETGKEEESEGICQQMFNKHFKGITQYVMQNGKAKDNPFLMSSNDQYISMKSSDLMPHKEHILEANQSKSVHGITHNGASFFKSQCQRMAYNEWGIVVENNTDDQWTIAWAIFVQENIINKYGHAYKDCEEIVYQYKQTHQNDPDAKNLTREEILTKLDSADDRKLLNSIDEEIKKTLDDTRSFFNTIRQCGALAYMTTHSDYDAESASAKKKASADGTIQCIREGVLTQDYKACNNIINAYDAALLAEQGIIAAQQIDYTSKQTDWQLELQEDEDAVKGPIRIQIKNLEQQQKYARQQEVAYGAKAATLGTLTGAMPTMKSLIKSCSKDYPADDKDSGYSMKDYAFVMSKVIGDTSVEKYYNADGSLADGAYQSAGIMASSSGEDESATVQNAAYSKGSVCGTTIKNHSDLNLILNDTGKSQALAAVVQAGIQVAEQELIISAIGKNISKLTAMLNDIDDYDPSELGYSIADLLAQECEINPDNEACNTDLDSSTRVGFVGQSFSVGSTGRSGTGDYTLPDTDATVSSTTSTSDADTDTIAAINTSSSGSSGISNAVRAGSLKAATRSGGSGGVSAGRVAAPSGGSSGRSAARSPASRYKSKDYSYNGSSKGVSYSGGSSKSKSKSSSSNPFSKLFNKSAKNGKDVVNFRELASSGKIGSSSGRNLFKMISDRYDSVSKNDQLLEYTKDE